MRPVMVAALLVCSSRAATYYVDCAAGSDAASGTSPPAAWRSLAKVSGANFAPGDAVLLRRGEECVGMWWPKGSGDDGRPIRLGAYGAGSLPRVRAAGDEAAVKLENQEYWEIENLDPPCHDQHCRCGERVREQWPQPQAGTPPGRHLHRHLGLRLA